MYVNKIWLKLEIIIDALDKFHCEPATVART